MKRTLFALITATIYTSNLFAQISEYDLNKPFGWCTCKDYTTIGYTMNGAEASETKKTITLTSTNKDQCSEISKAIQEYDVIIFDGSKGDFILTNNFHINSKKNKTIVGINNARLCTEFYITPELTKLLDNAGVRTASTSKGTGGILSTGAKVGEQREYLTRQTLINAGYDDDQIRSSGLMAFNDCENIIIRNINFIGPGPIDVGGCDLLTLSRCRNVWVDHCSFTDGIDGNFDINQESNLITISWCIFQYTDRAYDHMNTNLVGANDHDGLNANKHNVTFANCMWGKRCKQRMPMVRNGIIHLLNNYYNCPDNNVSINPRSGSHFIVEGISVAKGVKLFSQTGALSYHFCKGYYENGFDEKDKNFGPTIKLPYKYNIYKASKVAEIVTNYAGATLTNPLSFKQ